MFKRILATGLVVLLAALPALAQVSIPNTLVSGTVIKASDLNTNFSTLGNHSLDRISGGNISGNVTADPGVTIDGIDLSVALCASCAATFGSVTVNGVGVIAASGKIPGLTATYFTSIDASTLTGLAAGNIATGTVGTARLGSGSAVISTLLRGDSTWGPGLFPLATKSAPYTATNADRILLVSGATTITLYTCTGNTSQWIEVKKTDSSNSVIIDANASETIDGALTQTLTVQYQAYTLVCDGTSWFII